MSPFCVVGAARLSPSKYRYHVPMRRRLLNLLTALSLLLCVAVAMSWAPSFRAAYRVGRVWVDPSETRVTSVRLQITCGGLAGSIARFPVGTRESLKQMGWLCGTRPPTQFVENPLQFGANRDDIDLDRVTEWAVVPLWIVIAMTAALPAIRLTVWTRRRRRKQTGSPCPSCGYDLRATPDR